MEFAIQRCYEYIGMQNHEDIDTFEVLPVWEHQWDQFLTSYYLAVHDNFILMECRRPAVQVCYILLVICKFSYILTNQPKPQDIEVQILHQYEQ